MTTTIGRAVFTNAPSQLAWDGDTLTVNITINPSTLEQAKVLRQQVLGLANNADEPVVPFTSTEDPDLDGYYVVEGVIVDPIRTYLASKLIRCGIGLRRVTGGYAKPAIEVSFVMADITNPHGITERARIGVPNNGQEVTSNATLQAATYITTETGPVALLDADPIVTPIPRSGVVRYWVGPSDYYDGAATLEVLIGATWYPVVGQQLPANFTRWRLSNGWFRFGPTVTATPFYMLGEGWNGSSWVTVGTFERGVATPGWVRHDFGASNPTFAAIPGSSILATPQILRNGPETVTIRIPQVYGFETWSIARGEAFVRGFYTDVVTGNQPGIGMSTAIAVTDGVYGMVRTTASSGFKFFVSQMVANTVDGANGRVYTTALAGSVNFAIGFSTPTTYGAIDESSYSLAMASQRQRVAAR